VVGLQVTGSEAPFPHNPVILEDDGRKAWNPGLDAQGIEVTLEQEKRQGLRTEADAAEERSDRYKGQDGQPKARGHGVVAEVA
jgi:hypothetical protein